MSTPSVPVTSRAVVVISPPFIVISELAVDMTLTGRLMVENTSGEGDVFGFFVSGSLLSRAMAFLFLPLDLFPLPCSCSFSACFAKTERQKHKHYYIITRTYALILTQCQKSMYIHVQYGV